MAAPDLSVVTSVIDFDTVAAALVSVGVALIVVEVVWTGCRLVLTAVSGESQSARRQRLDEYSAENISRGLYVPRAEFEAWMRRNPLLAHEGRRYAKKMAKSELW